MEGNRRYNRKRDDWLGKYWQAGLLRLMQGSVEGRCLRKNRPRSSGGKHRANKRKAQNTTRQDRTVTTMPFLILAVLNTENAAL